MRNQIHEDTTALINGLVRFDLHTELLNSEPSKRTDDALIKEKDFAEGCLTAVRNKYACGLISAFEYKYASLVIQDYIDSIGLLLISRKV